VKERSLGKRGWVEDENKANIKKIACEDADWIQVAEDKRQWLTLLNNYNEPPGSIICG
jgi:hypothetical protein